MKQPTSIQFVFDKSRSLYKNLAVLLSGTVLAQLVNILASPILSRVYEPDAFGIFGLYSAVGMVLSLPATLRYDLAIVLPDEDDDGVKLVHLAFVCLVLVSLALAVALAMGRVASGIAGLHVSEHWSWLWFVPGIVFARGVYVIATSWSMRKESFRDITTSRISQPVTTVTAQIAGGLAGLGSLGLVGGQLAGQVVASAVLVRMVLRRFAGMLLRRYDRSQILHIAKEYSQFPLYSAPQSFVSLVSQYLPIFVFARFFDTVFVGYYTLMDRVVQLPLTIVGQAVREAFLPQIVNAHRRGEAYQELKRMVFLLALVGGVPAAIIVPLAPALFSFVFGEEWRIAGVYAQVVAPYVVTAFVIPPATSAMNALQQQRWFAQYEFGKAIVSIVATVVGGVSQNPILALGLFSAVGVAAHLVLIAHAFRVAKRVA